MTQRYRLLLIATALAVVGAAGFYAYERWGRQAPLAEGLIQANGRLEGDEITVSTKFAGRVAELCAREGDAVSAGEVLIRMEDAQTRARVAQAVHAEAAAQAQLRAGRTALASLEAEVPLSIQTADAGITLAQAAFEKAQAAEQQAGREADRYRELAARGSFGIQKSEDADLAWTLARRDVEASRIAVTQAQRQLAQARLGVERIAAQRSQVAALEAGLAQARAAVDDVNSVLRDLTIRAPIAGIVTTRMSDIGEVVTAGAPLLTLVDPDRLYLKVYVPELQIGLVRLGLPARVYIDAFPDRPFNATVRYIASRAEFTPKEVQTPDERVKLVYAVKLYLEDNPEHRLTPGQPADAIIQWRRDAPWTPPRR